MRSVMFGLATGGIVLCILYSAALGQQANPLNAPLPASIANEPNAAAIAKAVRRCGTVAPDATHRAALRLRVASVRAANMPAMNSAGPIDIRVCVHVIHKGEIGKVTDARITKQIQVLNDGFAAHGFRFHLHSVDRKDVADPAVNKPAWFTMSINSLAELEAKTAMGVDPTAHLNLYTCAPSDPLLGDLLGFATFPWELTANPKRDGVVVLHTTLPDGNAPFDLGRTATHEVGHWLGLFHTFQGGCASPGDEVDDTPAQDDGNNIFECNPMLDTCTASAGKDPVANFMNYADDACLTEFTVGQRERMLLHVGSFRPLLVGAPTARAALRTANAP